MFSSIILEQMRTLSALSAVLAATHPETKRVELSHHPTRLEHVTVLFDYM